jgi:hypothetical protein
MARIRITQLDGRLPNLALMRLSAYHKSYGDEVVFSRSPYRDFLEPSYDKVYGSAIFSFSAERVRHFQTQFPDAIIGGTWDRGNLTVEELIGPQDCGLDYSLYPEFTASLGFTQRGCRFKCGFCVVPKKEGRPVEAATITELWRGNPWPKHLHLLDNDFFGQPEDAWRSRISELRRGRFKVCFNQGINIRVINGTTAAALASVDYRDDSFNSKRIYTAWDTLGDEEKFFAGVDCLERHGIPSYHLMPYMLIGYDRRETWDRVLYRFQRMADRDIRPYPMIYGDRNRTLPSEDSVMAQRTLAQFQRWVLRRQYEILPFRNYQNPPPPKVSREQIPFAF